MSRRKCTAPREKSGRILRRPAEIMSPTEIRRLTDGAAAGLKDPIWGSTIGRLYLQSKISSAQFAVAKHWMELVRGYSTACCSPQPPRTVALDKTGGTPADPFSEAGMREARRHERATARFLDGRHALRLVGPTAERVVDSVCIHDYAPVGVVELEALQNGLQALSSATKRKGAR